MKVSRRHLAIALASPLAAQTPPAKPTPEADLESAQKQIRANAEELRKRKLSPSLEPSFSFRP